ncbi:hypothetical protein ACIBEA_01535 [Streptomyces sp. NPDC051555]|uniref:hypothetical protein n=1 Tax=Streptomyces sp. NPDC051555 TaxID=3365657 RepID=UPI0037B3E766
MHRKRSIPQPSGGQTLLRLVLATVLAPLCLLVALLLYRWGGSATLDVVGFALTLVALLFAIGLWVARERRVRRIRRERRERARRRAP